MIAPACAALLASSARAEWQRTETTLGWAAEGRTGWQFSFYPAKG